MTISESIQKLLDSDWLNSAAAQNHIAKVGKPTSSEGHKMTFQKFAEKFLESRGIFPLHAEQIIDNTKANHPEFSGLWEDVVDDYLPIIKQAVAILLKQEGLSWIDKNLPKSVFRPMFVSEASESTEE